MPGSGSPKSLGPWRPGPTSGGDLWTVPARGRDIWAQMWARVGGALPLAPAAEPKPSPSGGRRWTSRWTRRRIQEGRAGVGSFPGPQARSPIEDRG